MIEKDLMPINTVDSKGFRPVYRILSRGTITSCIVLRFREMKGELYILKLASAERVALPTNCWTTLTTERSEITVTAHYIGTISCPAYRKYARETYGWQLSREVEGDCAGMGTSWSSHSLRPCQRK